MNIHATDYYQKYFTQARDAGLISESDTAVIFYDFGRLEKNIRRVEAAFPETAVHAVAIKTNPLGCVLRKSSELGLAAEAASFEELVLANNAGFGSKLVWDSPAKTALEIKTANDLQPMLVNANSLQELDRYNAYPDLTLGLRVNPEVCPDTVSSLAVGKAGSKFGVPISNKKAIIKAFIAHENLVGLHVHSSSNTRTLDSLLEGVKKVGELAVEINAALAATNTQRRLTYIDIGGGLPMDDPTDDSASLEHYAVLLKEHCPILFTEYIQLITEFGRFYHANAGWTAAKVEYVTKSGEITNILTHVGADHFLRETYDSDHLDLEIDVLNQKSDTGSVDKQPGRICGPLCFAGDILAEWMMLKHVNPGDYLAIKNTGANTYSLWSRHCSRAFPKVITFNSTDDNYPMCIGRPRELTEDIIKFWY